MVDKKRFLSIGYYAKAESFTGSDKNKRFKVQKIVDEESGEKSLLATIWPGPFCYDKTDDSLKQTKVASFSDDGLTELVDWINSTTV